MIDERNDPMSFGSPALLRIAAPRIAPVVFAGLAALTLIAAPGESVEAQDGPPLGLTGTVVVVNKSGDDVSFVDLASGEIVATAPTGRGPHELVVSSDGSTAVVTDYAGGNSLTVLDVASAEVVRTIDLSGFPRPHGIAFMPGDEVVAVTSEAAGAVVLVRIADGEIVGSVATEAEGSHMLAVTADGGTIWTGDIGSNTVTELDVGEMRRIRSFSAPAEPEAVNVTPDGSRVLAGSNATGRVTAFDTSDGTPITVAEGFGWPYRIYLTPGVERIVIPDLRGEALRIIDGSDYRELGRLDFTDEGPQGLILHPDGRHLFLSLNRADRIAVIDIDAQEVVGYLPAGSGPDGIGYSPVTARR